MLRYVASLILLLMLALGCASPRSANPAADGARPPAADSVAAPSPALDGVAASYLRLVLAVGTHDPDYVDAYYGPPALRAQADSQKMPLAEIRSRADALLATLAATSLMRDDTLGVLRHAYLTKQLQSLAARVDMLGGRKLTFDEESRALYDAEAPTLPESHFRAVLDRLDRALPGTGPVPARFAAFRSQFTIPPERLDTVFKAAIAECRARTLRHVALPPGESFVVEYVTGKSWSAYNWYQGGYRSLIQVNTGMPISIDRAVDLACHEGYPGHHAYNALLEQKLVRDRGWTEFSVYPLFSPQSLIAEGSANYGVRIAFPGDGRVAYERATLFPLAGLDPSRAAAYYAVQELVRDLSYAGNEAARRYLNGEIDAKAATEWLVAYALMSPGAAAQRIRFFDTYRSYVINYNYGQDLVGRYVERTAGTSTEARWRTFADLLASPRLPSGLR